MGGPLTDRRVGFKLGGDVRFRPIADIRGSVAAFSRAVITGGMNRLLDAVVSGAAALCVLGCQSIEADFPSGSINPPPAPLTYLSALERNEWTFGEVVWRPSGPCSQISCEAGYNADPIFVLVKIAALCCGQQGATVTFMASSRACPSPSYFVALPELVAQMTRAEMDAFIARKTSEVVGSLGSRCALPPQVSIPTSPLGALTTGYTGPVR